MNITKEKLIAKGYTQYPCAYKGEFCTGLFQKVVMQDRIRLYFINVYLWSFPNRHASASVEVRLYCRKGQFDVNYIIDFDTTVDDVEVFYCDVFERLNCLPDQDNND